MANWHLIAAAAGVAIIGSACPSPRNVPTDTQLKKIDASVVAAVRERADVHVVVALLEPAVNGQPIPDRTVRRAQIARMQREVLTRLSDQDYRNRTLFQDVPAMAGTIRHERALRVLDGHPHVVRVDPDPAGGGIRN